MPSRNQFKTKEEYNAYFRAYKAKDRLKWRAYNRIYMKAWRKRHKTSKKVIHRKKA